MTTKTLALRLPLGLYEQLEREAMDRKMSVAEIIVESVEVRQLARTTMEVMPTHLARLRVALIDCIDLIEGWAYGPMFQQAGVRWPEGKCQATALVAAKALIGRDIDDLRRK